MTPLPPSVRTARGLYLITPEEPDTARLLARVAAVLPQATWLQYRQKGADPDLRLVQAAGLQALCREVGVPLIINDDVALAAAISAAGVHLGEEDGDIAAARAQLGAQAIIGASCYDAHARAERAVAAGASYVAFGAFFPTTTKEAPTQAEPEILTIWQQFMETPCVAIGGINADNAAGLAKAGADFLAVSAGVWAHPEGPAAAVRAIEAAIAQGLSERG